MIAFYYNCNFVSFFEMQRKVAIFSICVVRTRNLAHSLFFVEII